MAESFHSYKCGYAGGMVTVYCFLVVNLDGTTHAPATHKLSGKMMLDDEY